MLKNVQIFICSSCFWYVERWAVLNEIHWIYCWLLISISAIFLPTSGLPNYIKRYVTVINYALNHRLWGFHAIPNYLSEQYRSVHIIPKDWVWIPIQWSTLALLLTASVPQIAISTADSSDKYTKLKKKSHKFSTSFAIIFVTLKLNLRAAIRIFIRKCLYTNPIFQCCSVNHAHNVIDGCIFLDRIWFK